MVNEKVSSESPVKGPFKTFEKFKLGSITVELGPWAKRTTVEDLRVT